MRTEPSPVTSATATWTQVSSLREVSVKAGVSCTRLRVADESARTRMIGDICRLIREAEIPESTRTAGLELIGWLARRMPGESAHAVGVEEARESQRHMKAARRKAR
jgi:hypothetical protein